MVAESKLGVRLRSKLFDAIANQEVAFFDETETGDITSRLTSDVTKVSDAVPLNVNVFLRSLVQAIGVVGFMAALNWRLTLVTFVSIPLVAVISKYYGAYYKTLSKAVQQSFAEANDVAENTVSAIRTVRSFANEDAESVRYRKKLDDAYKNKIKQAQAYIGYSAVVTALPLLVTALCLWYGGELIAGGSMTGGTLISFAFYQMSLSDAINTMGWVFSGMMDALGASEKVIEYMDRVPQSKPSGGYAPKVLKGVLEFKDVKFSYPSRPHAKVLEGVSFKVNPGEIVALVGESGGGKSSCMSLIERFYDLRGGAITLDGVDINEYDHHFYHQNVVIVGQEPVLTSPTIGENIGYALHPPPEQPEIEAAAKLANCHNFTAELKDGYDTKTGEKGVQLSGGQKQRVAIARALVRDPKVLLLDEATSALDTTSEAVVQEAIEHNLEGRTVLLIAHRLSTVQKANRIIVIKKGKVVEQGTHAELLAVKGVYHELVEKQFAQSKKEIEEAEAVAELAKVNVPLE